MSEESTGYASIEEARADSRGALQASLESFKIEPEQDTAQIEPGSVDAPPETDPSPATPVEKDLPVVTQPDVTPVAETQTPAPVAPQQPPTPKPEVVVPKREALKITPELMEKTALRLIEERKGFREEAQFLESYRNELVQARAQRDELAASIPTIEKEIQEETIRLEYSKALLAKNPEDSEMKDIVAEHRVNIQEKRSLLAVQRSCLLEIKQGVSEMEATHSQRVQALRAEVTNELKQGDEKERETAERASQVERYGNEWTAAFTAYCDEQKVPESVKPNLLGYLAAYGSANNEVFDNGVSFLDFMRQRGQDILDILTLGKEAGARGYQDAKRRDAEQPAPDLKPDGKPSEPDKKQTIEEIRKGTRTLLEQRLRA
jgi:hypothetical protein